MITIENFFLKKKGGNLSACVVVVSVVPMEQGTPRWHAAHKNFCGFFEKGKKTKKIRSPSVPGGSAQRVRDGTDSLLVQFGSWSLDRRDGERTARLASSPRGKGEKRGKPARKTREWSGFPFCGSLPHRAGGENHRRGKQSTSSFSTWVLFSLVFHVFAPLFSFM